MTIRDDAIPLTGPRTLDEAAPGLLADARVLLVDDNILCCRIGHRVFSQLGASVECVTSGDEALELAALRQFDIIVVDSALGDKSGLDVAKRLRRLGTQSESTAIIALSPTAPAGLLEIAGDLGIQAILEKPLCGHSVAAAVESIAVK